MTNEMITTKETTTTMAKAEIKKKTTTMAKEESEKKKTPEGEENGEKKEILEVKKLPGTKPKVAVKKQPPGYKMDIDARLNEVIKGAKPLNRSFDLVPLGQDFDQMRKRLRSLIAAVKQHHAARVQVEKTRMEVRTL
jgi:hypothetical protein